MVELIIFGAICGVIAHFLDKNAPLTRILGAMIVGVAGAFLAYMLTYMVTDGARILTGYNVFIGAIGAATFLFLRKASYRL